MNTTIEPIHQAGETDIRAVFNPLVRPYLVLKIGFIIASTIIGIPLAIVWFCGVGQWWARHYYDKLECRLGPRSLRFRRGIFVQVEKTIPLENIQDVTFIEGPILRRFHLSILKFETAGQSAGQAHDMHFVGIINAHDFRNAILHTRDVLRQQMFRGSSASTSADELLATVKGIELRMDDIVAILKKRA